MNVLSPTRFAGLMALVLAGKVVCSTPPASEELLSLLLAAYATQPQGYPRIKDYARPDLSAPFRWHFYHDEAIARFEDAKMDIHVEPYNVLEEGGVKVQKGSSVKWSFVTEHVTQGNKALRLEVPESAIRANRASVTIQGISGGPTFYPFYLPTASCYWPHYRWLKLDVFNPQGEEVKVRVAHVPMILHPGHNIVAVKTADAAPYGSVANPRPGIFLEFQLQVVAPTRNIVLFVDNVRMEQEVPAVIKARGKMFHFAGRIQHPHPEKVAVLWPGFTLVDGATLYNREQKYGWTDQAKTTANGWVGFRSSENGILWGWNGSTSPFRIDLPDGRYGIYLFAPGDLAKGATVEVHGHKLEFLAPLGSEEKVKAAVLGGELWDYQPGSCIWEELVRPPYFPHTRCVYADTVDGHLLIKPPSGLRVLMVFPEADKEEALREIGRFNLLLAESWDVTHFWVAGPRAEQLNFIGHHEEASRPEAIPARLRALQLGTEDFRRGFKLFQRGLTEPVYPDTIPTPAETNFQELRCLAAPGQRECVTLGLLPLRTVKGLKVTVADLHGPGGARISAELIDLRFSRYHQKVMQYAHHNHAFNYQEHYLVKRPRLDLYPAAARRCYLDMAVPADALPGEYRGEVKIEDASGNCLARVPLICRVLPLELKEPPVYFAGYGGHKQDGLNTLIFAHDVARARETAIRQGLKGYMVDLSYDHWNNFLAQKERLQPLLAESRSGKEPRAFLGGLPPGQEDPARYFATVLRVFPQLDIFKFTIPVYTAPAGPAQPPHEWMIFRTDRGGTMLRGTEPALLAAQQTGKEFWFIDGMRAKEHAARFSYGIWLWRLGAAGRFTPFSNDYGLFGIPSAYDWHRREPYFVNVGHSASNVTAALKESLVTGAMNPARDLVLVRAGIDDYRYLYTLDWWLQQARQKKLTAPAVVAAQKFRDEIQAAVSLDLSCYYTFFSGDYAEEWLVRPDNPWTTEKLDTLRRQAAGHILALQQAVGK